MNISHFVQSDAPRQGPVNGLKGGRAVDWSHTDGKDLPSAPNDYRYEINRLGTFKNWPPRAAVHPHDLARDGFVFTGTSDRAQCVYCSIRIFNWESGDVVHDEHRKHKPSCPFVNGQNVGNVPMDNSGKDRDIPPSSSAASFLVENETTEDRTSSAQTAEQNTSILDVKMPKPTTRDQKAVLSSLGINPPLNPKHPKYMLEVSRLNTFKTWPSHFPMKPEDLAKAGFFYLGSGDKTKCFCCNGNLMNWESGDDPMTEHARWFPDCEYIKLIKGQDFINSIKNNSQASAATSENFTRFGGNNATETMAQQSTIPEKVEAVMQFGYTREQIDNALQKHGKHLDQFQNAETLLTFMLETEEETSFKPDGMSESEMHKMLTEEEPLATRRDSPGPVSVWTENEEMKEQRLCKICLENEACVVFLPCGHLVACGSCAAALSKCPMCRKPIKGIVRAYLA